MNYAIDTLWVKRFEREHGIKLNSQTLEDARDNEGIFNIYIQGRYQYFVIPLLIFPFDLTNTVPEESPWD